MKVDMSVAFSSRRISPLSVLVSPWPLHSDHGILDSNSRINIARSGDLDGKMRVRIHGL